MAESKQLGIFDSIISRLAGRQAEAQAAHEAPDPDEQRRITEEARRELEQERKLEQYRRDAQAREGAAREVEVIDGGRDIGYSARLLVQATLPHSKPRATQTEFERSNGYVTVKIHGDSAFGLPYGTYPRLLLSWVTTEAVRTDRPDLELGGSLYEFLAKLEMRPTGGPQGSYPRMRQHMQRLFSSMISATYQTDGEWRSVGFRPIERAHLFWDPRRPNQTSLWKSSITLNQSFFTEITSRPVPVDLDALKLLAKNRSPMALDIYQWLTFRMSYLRRPTEIPWPTLELQFGCGYKRTRDFRRGFLRHLKRVLEVYPDARLEDLGERGLKLRPSLPHVSKRLAAAR